MTHSLFWFALAFFSHGMCACCACTVERGHSQKEITAQKMVDKVLIEAINAHGRVMLDWIHGANASVEKRIDKDRVNIIDEWQHNKT